MKFKEGYRLRTLMGKHVVVKENNNSKTLTDLNKVLVLNTSAAYLWENFEGKSFTLLDVTSVLLQTYDIEPDVARRDAMAFIDKLARYSMLE